MPRDIYQGQASLFSPVAHMLLYHLVAAFGACSLQRTAVVAFGASCTTEVDMFKLTKNKFHSCFAYAVS
jgi:hypothetical protein